jgi:hypothetical protein
MSVIKVSAIAPDAPRTKAGTPLVKLALSRAKRKGGVVEVFATAAPANRTALGLRDNDCHTGQWTYNSRKRRHEIALDPNFHTSVTGVAKPYRGLQEWWLEYATAILRHEVHHAMHTERDFYLVDRDCKAHDVPFISLNVAEDIRIDTLARKVHGFYDWYRYYQPDAKSAKVTEPLAWLVFWKLCEGYWSRLSPRITWTGVATVERVRLGKPDGLGKRPAERVLQEFADDFSRAANTRALVPLLRDLFLTFPSAQKDIGKIGGLPSGIVGHGYNGAGMGKPDGAVVAADVTVVTGAEGKLPEHLSADIEYFLGSSYGVTSKSTIAEAEKLVRRDILAIGAKVSKVAGRLGGLLGQLGGAPTRLSSSGSRLHVRGVMVGDSQSFRVSGKRKGEKPKVVVVFDQSGSMVNDWESHGAAFMGAFLLLSQQGRLDVTCILTGDHSHAVVPRNFPSDQTGRFVCMSGCESVDKTLRANKKAIVAADIAIVYTDGALTDGRVNAAEWRRHGVDLIGAAVGGSAYGTSTKREALTKHFGRSIIAEDGEALATKIVQYIATR